MKPAMKRILSGAMTLSILGSLLMAPVQAAKPNAYDRPFGQISGDTHCTEQAVGHDYHSQITLEPTAEQEGEETFTCTRCGDTYTATLPKLEPQQEDAGQEQEPSPPEEEAAHTHTWREEETPASCTRSGESAQVCTQCGVREVLETTDALGHSYEEELTRQPTTEQEGTKTFTCTRCGDTYTEPVPKLVPQDDPEADAGEANSALTGNEPTGTCIDAFGRSYARVVGGTYYAEQYQKNIFTGRIQSYNCPENPGGKHQLTYHKQEPTCEEGDSNYYVCTLCGEKEIYLDFPALGHAYTDRITRPATAEREGERTFTCSRCGDSYTETISKLQSAIENPVERDPNAQAVQSDNLGDNSYSAYHSNPMRSYLYRRADGGYTRVEALENTVAVEAYDADFQLMTADTVPMELPLFGGFFAGESYHFLIFGQENTGESDSTEVIRVVKYDKNWNRLGQASLRGANTRTPFLAGSLRCTEYYGMLYVLTCHEMYASSDGQHHQANMAFSVRQSDMAITDSQYRVASIDAGYVSHSFNQFILVDEEGRLVAYNHGDAYPRGAILTRYDLPAGEDTFLNLGVKDAKVMEFVSSSKHYNYTGASLGGLAESDSYYLTALSTVPQTGSVEDHDVSNVVVTATSKSSFSGTQTTSLTNYAQGGSQSAGTPYLVALSQDRFLVIWNILTKDSYGYFRAGTQIGYAFVDGSGRMIGSGYTAQGALSDCQPIYSGSHVVWYTTQNSTPVFYTIQGSSGTFWSSGTLQGAGSEEAGPSNEPSTQLPGHSSSGSPSPSDGFRDVSASYWGRPYIDKVVQTGLMTGTDTGSFDPTGSLTLAQVMVLAYQIHSRETGGTLPSAEGAWYMPYYQYCLNEGILTSGQITPSRLNNRASRFDMVAVLDRAIPDSRLTAEREVPNGSIPDLDEADPYGQAVYRWYRAGLVTGDLEGRFNGETGITRAETAVILCQINRLV